MRTTIIKYGIAFHLQLISPTLQLNSSLQPSNSNSSLQLFAFTYPNFTFYTFHFTLPSNSNSLSRFSLMDNPAIPLFHNYIIP